MAEILNFTGSTRLDIDPNDVLEAAQGKLSEVIIIGVDHDDHLYFASHTSSGPRINWLIDRVKAKLVNGDYSDDRQ